MPYSHNNKDPNLNNLHHAMQYRDDNTPELRVNVGAGIDISGTVNIPGNIIVGNDVDNPVLNHIIKVGTSGELTVPYMPVGGTIDLSTTTLTNIENLGLNIASLPQITGTVELGITTLGSLEIITARQGTTPWIVDGSVSATVSGTVSVDNFPTTQTVDGSVSATVSGTVSVDNFPATQIVDGTVNINLKDTQTDAFGRLRVSDPFTLFDSSLRYSDDPNKWDTSLTGTASAVHLSNESSMQLSVSTTGDQVIRETKCVFSYQPGKSLLILNTFVMQSAVLGLRQRVGYFGSQNGVYLELNNLDISFVIRKYTDGSVDDTSEKVLRENWNGDRLDGNGSSGISLDLSKAQIFWCDVEWLGVGGVRCGFVINNKFIVCHTFNHANIFDKVYMTTATLPCRYEITSTGASGVLKQICSSVISEGGYVNRSITRAAGTALTGKNLSNSSYTPLIAIRMKNTQLDSVVVPTKFDLYGLQQAAFSYRVILNPVLTNENWVSASTDSAVEYDISATELSGGIIVDQGIFVGSNKGGSASVSSADVDFSQQLGRTIAGVSDIWCIAARATTNNDDAVASVSWQEHV